MTNFFLSQARRWASRVVDRKFANYLGTPTVFIGCKTHAEHMFVKHGDNWDSEGKFVSQITEILNDHL
jgi:hypothetical protein